MIMAGHLVHCITGAFVVWSDDACRLERKYARGLIVPYTLEDFDWSYSLDDRR
jgi:hypothetical protein